MLISEGIFPICVRKIMNRRMHRVYLGLFRNYPIGILNQDILMIQNQLFASVAISSTLTPILAKNDWTKGQMY